jgi:hypothetical protein
MNIEIYFYENNVGILPTHGMWVRFIQSRPCIRRPLHAYEKNVYR